MLGLYGLIIEKPYHCSVPEWHLRGRNILAGLRSAVGNVSEIIYTAILLSSTNSRRVVVSYKRTYVQEILVSCLVKLAEEKVLFSELTIST